MGHQQLAVFEMICAGGVPFTHQIKGTPMCPNFGSSP